MNLDLYEDGNTRYLAGQEWIMTCTDGGTPTFGQGIVHPRSSSPGRCPWAGRTSDLRPDRTERLVEHVTNACRIPALQGLMPRG